MTYYLLYIYHHNQNTARNTHVTYRAVRTTATANKWRTDPNIEASVLIPERILHIFTEEPELMTILDYQRLSDPIVTGGVVVAKFSTRTKVFKYLGSRSARGELVIPIDKRAKMLI